ncbi:MAG: penicillin-binding transpeptidase domain-containing protein, partial [Chitinophagales bacterium]|nr:penicillin-binding transpeptidase domain-containing protein [Chitinophagales bacterium]MDW8274417.1 penicillin-binding transpeptidase domain-containing protein [Chitinophagales bacterium]
MNKRQQILLRVRLGFLAVSLAGFAILTKAFYIQAYQGNYYKSLADSFTISRIVLPAERGNIFSHNGSVLATTLPFFNLGMDVRTSLRNSKVFREQVDSFCLLLHTTFGDKSSAAYKKEILNKRKKGNTYFIIQKNIPWEVRSQMEKWPLVREGRYVSGLVFEEHTSRLKPFGNLAARTVGYVKSNTHEKIGVGLEKKFDSILTGTPGNTLAQKLPGGLRIPLESPENTLPQPGKNIYTSIDIDFQDVAHDALLRALQYHKADHGCVILMECQTGKIRAIVNLGITSDSTYDEIKNYAFAETEAPGSTFKTAVAAALLEDGFVAPFVKIETGGGETEFYGLKIRDHTPPEANTITLQRALETSSNVAFALLAHKYYNHITGREKLYRYFERFGFTQKISAELEGAALPVIKHYKKWSATSVPFLAHGYEMQITPMHTLMF